MLQDEYYADYDKMKERVKQHEKDGFTISIQAIRTNDGVTFWYIHGAREMRK